MSIALYRRYRPERFSDLIGQDVVAQTLRNEVVAGTLAHAYLFAGSRGTGKTSTARILARAVNCESLQDGEPDNTCGACREILDGASVDVLEIDAASNRGIDEMRDLRDKVKYLPASLRRKVYIIDEAHMLTTEAWNAFLKTLEEPPDHVLFVLATTEPHKVPETVRSRVQRFDFRRIATPDIASHLTAVVGREDVKAHADALQLLAQSAQGSVRDALSLLDQALSSAPQPLTVEAARRALGLTDPAILHELMRALAGADAAGSLRAASVAFAAGADPRQLLREVARLARAAEITALGYPQGAEVAAEEAALCTDLAAVAPAGFWLRGLELFAEAEMNLRQPVDARLQVELCLLRLLRPPASADESVIEALEARIAALERGGHRSSGPAPTQSAEVRAAMKAPKESGGNEAPAVVPTPASPGSLFSLERWRSEWPVIIEAVSRADTMLGGVLRDCRPVEADTGKLVIGTQGRFHMDTISKPEKTAVIAEAATHVAATPVTVETRFTGEDRPVPEKPGTVSEMTQAVLQTFSGSRVVATRIREDAGASGPSERDDP
ncbi:MAG: DNA polymerase III subunit gamma/tau [Candidatus Dormibacteraeota bacterium]|nr:DNA polymerase III subunit gamma/tau [Candidatus Dormibacteraeota bacterium]